MEPASPIELSETPASRQITVACLGLFTDASILCDSLRFIEILFFCSFFLSFFLYIFEAGSSQDPHPIKALIEVSKDSQRVSKTLGMPQIPDEMLPGHQ